MFNELWEHKEPGLQFEAVAVIDEKTAYASGYGINGLFKIDLDTEECEFIKFFPDANIWTSRLFFSAVQGKRGIYFSPASADYIAVYDISSGKISQIPIPPLENMKKKSALKFGDVFCYHGCVYFVGATYRYILKLNENTGQISVIDLDIQDKFFFRRGMIVDNNYYISSANSPIILEYSLETDKAIIHKIGNEGGSWSMCYDGEKFWLPPRAKGDPILCWNRDTGIKESIAITIDDYKPQNSNFLKCFYADNKVIIFPECANVFLQIDVQTREIKKIDVPFSEGVYRYGFYFESDKYVYMPAYVQNGKAIDFKIEKETLETGRVKFGLKNFDSLESSVKETLNNKNEFNDIMRENTFFDISEFIALIQLTNAGATKENDKNVGTNIWLELL